MSVKPFCKGFYFLPNDMRIGCNEETMTFQSVKNFIGKEIKNGR